MAWHFGRGCPLFPRRRSSICRTLRLRDVPWFQRYQDNSARQGPSDLVGLRCIMYMQRTVVGNDPTSHRVTRDRMLTQQPIKLHGVRIWSSREDSSSSKFMDYSYGSTLQFYNITIQGLDLWVGRYLFSEYNQNHKRLRVPLLILTFIIYIVNSS